MIFNSIRWRLQLWHGLILLVVLAGFGFTAHRLQRANELRRVDQELQLRLGLVLEAVRRPPPGGRGGPGGPGDPGRPGDPRIGQGEADDRERRGPPPRESEGGFQSRREFLLGPNRAALFEGDTNAFYYVAWLRDGREWSRSATAPTSVALPEGGSSAKPTPTMRMRGTLRELYQFNQPGECIVVGRSIAPELANLDQLALWLSALGGAVLVLGLAGGWWLATRAIRPIHDISAAATKIATGDLSHRINTDSTDNELGQLAAVLNSTFARLESSFERQRQFTADASHELRTPVAVILSQTQATLARERNPAEYRETLESCERAAQRMRSLTESLLMLARLDAGQEPLRLGECDLAKVAADNLELVRPLAVKRGIHLHADLSAAVCQGDADRLAQVVTNLLTNAIDYNYDGGEVRITTGRRESTATLTVWNTGPGIPAEDVPHIFERFHRVDRSRSSAGHSGLGLAIVKAIVLAHGGSITARSETASGTTFTVTLPT